jgi:hypothetical protein
MQQLILGYTNQHFTRSRERSINSGWDAVTKCLITVIQCVENGPRNPEGYTLSSFLNSGKARLMVFLMP